MPLSLQFIDVGQGNMALVQIDGLNLVCDCNIKDDNAGRVLWLLNNWLPPQRRQIDIFINTHRDADHMRGIERLHGVFPIQQIWDNGASGGTPDSGEYRQYMQLRARRPRVVLRSHQVVRLGSAVLRVLHSANESRPDDCNRESLVFKIEYRGNSVLFTGDSDATTWRRIVARHPPAVLASTVLLGSHHGARSCFEDHPPPGPVRRLPIIGTPPPRLLGLGTPPPSARRLPPILPPPVVASGPVRRLAGVGSPPPILSADALEALRDLARAFRSPALYTAHLPLINPFVTVLSVGRDNPHGHPSPEAIRLYETHSRGAAVFNRPGEVIKVLRTDQVGDISLMLAEDGGWVIQWGPS